MDEVESKPGETEDSINDSRHMSAELPADRSSQQSNTSVIAESGEEILEASSSFPTHGRPTAVIKETQSIQDDSDASENFTNTADNVAHDFAQPSDSEMDSSLQQTSVSNNESGHSEVAKDSESSVLDLSKATRSDEFSMDASLENGLVDFREDVAPANDSTTSFSANDEELSAEVDHAANDAPTNGEQSADHQPYSRLDRREVIGSLKTVRKAPPCRVCGRKSTGVYYGVLSCRRCKTMFQRAVLHNLEIRCNKVDSEKGGGDGEKGDGGDGEKASDEKTSSEKAAVKSPPCVIDRATKAQSPCSECWLNKCFSVGMNALDARLRWNNHGRKLPLRCPRSMKDLTQMFRLIFVEYNRKVKIKYIRPILLSDRALEIGSPSYKHVMFSEFSQHYEPLVSSLINFSLHIPGFESLHVDDQMILLKTGFMDLWVILNAHRLHAVKGCITLHDNTQIPSSELITMYSKPYITSLKKVSTTIRKQRFSLTEKALVMAAALACPDRPNLLEKERIQELRKMMLKMKKFFSRLSGSLPSKAARKKADNRVTAILTAVSQLGKQHADLMNVYRDQPDRLTISPVIRELFDLHPPKTYKEK